MGNLINPDLSEEEVCKGVALSTEESAHYHSIVGIYLYISTESRPNIAFAASILRSYVYSSTTVNMTQAKQAVSYLRSAKDKISTMKHSASNQLSGYVGASWASSTERNGRSRAGILIYYGDLLIYTKSFAQRRVTLSST